MAISDLFDFKNRGELTLPKEVIHATDMYGMIGLSRGFGVISGCEISRSGNDITIAAGEVMISGSKVIFAGDTITVDDIGLSAGFHRWTIIHISPGGTLAQTKGVAVDLNSLPLKPTDLVNFVICAVYKIPGEDVSDESVRSAAINYVVNYDDQWTEDIFGDEEVNITYGQPDYQNAIEELDRQSLRIKVMTDAIVEKTFRCIYSISVVTDVDVPFARLITTASIPPLTPTLINTNYFKLDGITYKIEDGDVTLSGASNGSYEIPIEAWIIARVTAGIPAFEVTYSEPTGIDFVPIAKILIGGAGVSAPFRKPFRVYTVENLNGFSDVIQRRLYDYVKKVGIFWESGVVLTDPTTISGYIQVSSGVFQSRLRDVTTPARDTSVSDVVYYHNSGGGTDITSLTNLDDINNYGDGGSIGIAKYFNVVLFVVVTDDLNAEASQIWAEVQDEASPEYNSLGEARTDSQGKINYVLPSTISSNSMPIYRLILQHSGASNNNLLEIIDLRAGVAGAAISTGTAFGNVAFIDFDETLSSPSYSEGIVFYDKNNKSISYYNDNTDTALNVGQENWIRVYNNTGSTINNGQVVYITGAFSGLPTVGLAKADSKSTSIVVGLATHDIENATSGYITSSGIVRNFDTSSFSSGDDVFLSPTVAGALTSDGPSSPLLRIYIGSVTISDVSTGSVIVAIHDEFEGEFDYFDFTGTIPSYREGRLYYDSTRHALSFNTDEPEISLQVGQEMWARVYNNSGATITNGKVVYLTGVEPTENVGTIGLSRSDVLATSRGIGIATHDIENNTYGYITLIGRVRNIDTSSYPAGSILYISPTTAGEYTTTRPIDPNFATVVGAVLKQHATEGIIHAYFSHRGKGFGTTNELRGMNAAATEEEFKTIAGTTNQIDVTHSAGLITLDFPDHIYNPVDNGGFYTGATQQFRMSHNTNSLLTSTEGNIQIESTVGDIKLITGTNFIIEDSDDSFVSLLAMDTTARTLQVGRATDLIATALYGDTTNYGRFTIKDPLDSDVTLFAFNPFTAGGRTLQVGQTADFITSSFYGITNIYGTGDNFKLLRPISTAGFSVGMHFNMYNSVNSYHTYAQIFGSIAVNTDGLEDGRLLFYVSENGAASTEHMRIQNTGIHTLRDDFGYWSGASDELHMYHDQFGNSYIDNVVGSGLLILKNLTNAITIPNNAQIHNPADNAGFYTGLADNVRLYFSGTDGILTNATGKFIFHMASNDYFVLRDSAFTQYFRVNGSLIDFTGATLQFNSAGIHYIKTPVSSSSIYYRNTSNKDYFQFVNDGSYIVYNPQNTVTGDNSITITPQNALNAGTTYRAVYIDPQALDPATGAASNVNLVYMDARNLASTDNNTAVYGVRILPSKTELSYNFIVETQNRTNASGDIGFFHSGFTGDITVDSSYTGFKAYYQNITASANTPTIIGLQIDMMTDYVGFNGNSTQAASFTGDGRAVSICSTSYAIHTVGESKLDEWIFYTGGILTANTSAGTIRTRFINGKQNGADAHDTLFLNYNTGYGVDIGKNTDDITLTVYGTITTTGVINSTKAGYGAVPLISFDDTTTGSATGGQSFKMTGNRYESATDYLYGIEMTNAPSGNWAGFQVYDEQTYADTSAHAIIQYNAGTVITVLPARFNDIARMKNSKSLQFSSADLDHSHIVYDASLDALTFDGSTVSNDGRFIFTSNTTSTEKIRLYHDTEYAYMDVNSGLSSGFKFRYATSSPFTSMQDLLELSTTSVKAHQDLDLVTSVIKLNNVFGTAGQVLQVNAGGTALEWDTIAGAWTVSGSDIYYDSGNVGVGWTGAPTYNTFAVGGGTGSREIGFAQVTTNSHLNSNVEWTGATWQLVDSTYGGFNIWHDTVNQLVYFRISDDTSLSYNTAMIFDVNGKVGINVTPSEGRLEVYHDTTLEWAGVFDQDSATGYGLKVNVDAYSTNYPAFLVNNSTVGKVFEVSSYGTIAVGSAGVLTSGRAGFSFKPELVVTGTTSYGVLSIPVHTGAAVTTYWNNYYGFTFNGTSMDVFENIYVGNPGGSGAIATNYGILIAAQTKGTTNNYGLVIQGASGGSGDNYTLFVENDANAEQVLARFENDTAGASSAANITLASEGNNIQIVSYSDSHSTRAQENWILSSASGTDIIIAPVNSEVARFTSDGDVQIGAGSGDVTTVNGQLYLPNLTSLNQSNLQINTSNGVCYYPTSSRRYKKNITDLVMNTENLYQLRLVNYQSINVPEGQPDRVQIGVIAEEMMHLFPEMVNFEDAELTIPANVRYDMFVIPLIAEAKKAKEERDFFKSKLDALLSRIIALEGKVN